MRSIRFSDVGWQHLARTDSGIRVRGASRRWVGVTLVRYPPRGRSTVLKRRPFLSALAKARERGESRILLLLLCRVRLLHQGQVEPGTARPLGEASADRGPAEAPAPPAGPGPGGGQPHRDLFCQRLPTT